ncbi:bifunctional protein FolD 4, chloroplastic-like isoform X2 [Rhodamnia argentea]|uniref:Bifunctional protein FolD 4, chloroplastic-like isoform X2 n=1 Tax=Rhodamnia argentea TaxID=178133 RepID=A0A8B8QBD8_9MYRT|nr:bifunctional protein FolD 4, chloroplastic-like isoform X2 [Rhodamnia argentea]
MALSECSTSTASRFFPMSLRRDAAVLAPRLSLPHRSCASKVPSFRTLAVRASTPLLVASEACAKVIHGKYVSKLIRDEISAEVSGMKEAIGVAPGLAVIIVGDRKDFATYVPNKKKACESVGINSFEVHLPADSKEEEVLKFITGFNDDPLVHGILVQLPLPSHMNEQSILNAVSIEKDVDAFHPLNIGRLAMRGREPLFVPCTPKGCIELLHRYGIGIKGKRAVVIGRGNIVGMPAALLLQREDATISIVHSRTQNPEEITREADIIIAAVGQPNMVRGSWIKPGAVIIDVGINPVEDSKSSRGYKLVGDVCYEEACKVASATTPVPGGVGPMTIAMLLCNTLTSAKRTHNFQCVGCFRLYFTIRKTSSEIVQEDSLSTRTAFTCRCPYSLNCLFS